MGAKFHSELTNRDGVSTLKLAGVIDEDNELTSLEDKITGGPVVLDLSEIDRINSCGVRDWVNWLGRIEKTGARLVFINCSPAIVAQINLVHNFTATGIVKSFYAPYYCPRCQKEKQLRLETRDLVTQAPISQAPTCRCDECDGPMDFDDIEESYFSFLNNASKVLGDPSFENTMREIAAAADGGGRVKTRLSVGPSIPPVNNSSPLLSPLASNPGTPSSSSPANRTPTSKTPPGAPSQSRTPTGPQPSKVAASTSGIDHPPPQTSQPRPASMRDATSQHPPQGPTTGSTAIVPAGTTSPTASPRTGQNSVVKPKPPNVLPWVLLGLFLTAAVGLLMFVVLRK
jgi:anti-anti-sigma regulatory factor